jgi:WD40 repeat protein
MHKDLLQTAEHNSRCYRKHTNTLFSGGLDRQVYLWDVAQPRPDEPISTLQFPDLIGGEGGKGSIYALTSSE